MDPSSLIMKWQTIGDMKKHRRQTNHKVIMKQEWLNSMRQEWSMALNVQLWYWNGCILTHSTKLSSPKGWVGSTGLRPVISSKSTTPNENTSDLSVNFPLDAYSGAIYLKAKLDISMTITRDAFRRTVGNLELQLFLTFPYFPFSFVWKLKQTR